MSGAVNYTLSDKVRPEDKIQKSTAFKGMRLDKITYGDAVKMEKTQRI